MVSFFYKKKSRAVYKCFLTRCRNKSKLPTKCNKKEKLEECA